MFSHAYSKDVGVELLRDSLNYIFQMTLLLSWKMSIRLFVICASYKGNLKIFFEIYVYLFCVGNQSTMVRSLQILQFFRNEASK